MFCYVNVDRHILYFGKTNNDIIFENNKYIMRTKIIQDMDIGQNHRIRNYVAADFVAAGNPLREYFLENNIVCITLCGFLTLCGFIIVLGGFYQNLQVIRVTNTTHSNVELSMGKEIILEVDANFIESLSSGFICSHCKASSDWKLSSLH